MSRLLPWIFLAACASPKPVVGPAAVEARPVGKDVMADADKRYEAFSVANADALQAALEEARAQTAPVQGIDDRLPVQGGPVDYKREPSWLPDVKRFRIVYKQTVTMQQQQSMPGPGCSKYDHLRQRPDASPSPAPCPPPMPILITRSWSATMGLVLEYSEDGKLVAERPSPPAPVVPKPASPKG